MGLPFFIFRISPRWAFALALLRVLFLARLFSWELPPIDDILDESPVLIDGHYGLNSYNDFIYATLTR